MMLNTKNRIIENTQHKMKKIIIIILYNYYIKYWNKFTVNVVAFFHSFQSINVKWQLIILTKIVLNLDFCDAKW